MKTLLIAGSLIAIIVLVYVLLSKTKTDNSIDQRKVDSENNPYLMLRAAALEMKSATLGIETSKNDVFGVIMDWGLEEGTSTLVVFETGDVSMYYSSGGGMIGGITHEEVRKAGEIFLSNCKGFIKNAEVLQDLNLPTKDFVRFYFLTDDGILIAEESMRNFEKGDSKWLELFIAANNVITEFTKVTPQ